MQLDVVMEPTFKICTYEYIDKQMDMHNAKITKAYGQEWRWYHFATYYAS